VRFSSVSDKIGLIDFAKVLVASGRDSISTGGTAQGDSRAGLAGQGHQRAHRLSRDGMDGRCDETLHPKNSRGLLYIRGNSAHEAAGARARHRVHRFWWW
jgi:phosphoribosylaminoimidazolecarboxamide formyltransferase/IMP cyclohydrolase